MAVDFGTTYNNRLIFGNQDQYRATTALTLCAWVKPLETTGYSRHLFNRWYSTANGSAQTFFLSLASTGKYQFYAYNGANVYVQATNAIADTALHHVTARYNGATLQVFINGSPDGSLNYTNGIANPSNSSLVVGAQFNANPVRSNVFDARLYLTALSNEQIAAIYAAKGRDGIGGYALRTCIADGCVGLGSLSGKKVYDHSSYANNITATGAPTAIIDPYDPWR